jgi:hypothetical protein
LRNREWARIVFIHPQMSQICIWFFICAHLRNLRMMLCHLFALIRGLEIEAGDWV